MLCPGRRDNVSRHPPSTDHHAPDKALCTRTSSGTTNPVSPLSVVEGHPDSRFRGRRVEKSNAEYCVRFVPTPAPVPRTEPRPEPGRLFTLVGMVGCMTATRVAAARRTTGSEAERTPASTSHSLSRQLW